MDKYSSAFLLLVLLMNGGIQPQVVKANPYIQQNTISDHQDILASGSITKFNNGNNVNVERSSGECQNDTKLKCQEMANNPNEDLNDKNSRLKKPVVSTDSAESAGVIIQSRSNDIASLNTTIQMLIAMMMVLSLFIPFSQWRLEKKHKEEQENLIRIINNHFIEETNKVNKIINDKYYSKLNKLEELYENKVNELNIALKEQVADIFKYKYAPQMIAYLGRAVEESANTSQDSRVALYNLAGQLLDEVHTNVPQLYEPTSEYIKRWFALSQIFSSDKLVQEQGAEKLAYGTPTFTALSRLKELRKRYSGPEDFEFRNLLDNAILACDRGKPISAAENNRFTPPPFDIDDRDG